MEYRKKSDFYADIRNDYNEFNDDKTDSFIYQYRKGIKDDKACSEEYFRTVNNSRKDPYVFFKSCRIAVDEGKVAKSELYSLVAGMIAKLDISSEDMRTMLGEKDSNRKKELPESIKGRLIEKILNIDDQSSALFKRAYDYLCDRLIKDDVRDFFYNIGFNRKILLTSEPDTSKRVNKRKESAPEHDRRGRNDEALNMYFDFIRYKEKKNCEDGKEKSSQTDTYDLKRIDDENYIYECKKLYELLNVAMDDGKKSVFVPLIIDSESGLGIYIVSKNLLDIPNEKPVAEEEGTEKENYYYCCIRFVYHSRDNIGAYEVKKSEEDEADMEEYIQELMVVEEEDRNIYRNLYEKKRFLIPFVVEECFTELENAVNLFKYLKNQGTDFNGYGNLNKEYRDDIEDSDIVRHLKYFVAKEDFEDVFLERKRIMHDILLKHEIDKRMSPRRQWGKL